LPRMDPVKSARGLSEKLLAVAAPNEPYLIFPRLDASFPFYTHRFAVEPGGPATDVTEEEIHAWAARPDRVWVLAERDDYAKLEVAPRLFEVARDADAKEGYLLLTNQPPTERGR